MFSKTTTSHPSYEKGNQKPSMIKKKARTTILNVLNKRQTQEKHLAQAEKTSQLQSSITRRAEQETPKAFPQTASPTHRESVPEKTSRTFEQVTKDTDRYPRRERPDRQNSVSSLVRKWSADNLSQPTKPKAASFTNASLTKTVPKSVIVQQSCLSSSFPPSKKPDDDENRYSVVIQTSANYPPPLRRKSSADVTPHDVTVNAIRVYEATTKMVNADPELIASLDKYPSREPPVMSPTSVQRFTWERDVNTGVEKKTRAVVVKGKPLVPASRTTSTTDSEMRPRLVSDSVQVSIPFGVPDTPTSNRSSSSDGWSSSVSVCVPFQVSDNQVKPLPVKGGTRPQSLPPTDGLAIEDLNELFDRSDESGSLGYKTTTTPSMDPDSATLDIPTTCSASNRSPTLVTVRRKPEDELVQKIIHFQDSTVCNEPPDDVFDRQDGLCLSKRGNYSLAEYNSSVHTDAKKNSSSLTRQPESTSGSQKIRPRATLVDSKTPHSVTKEKTASLPASSNQGELDMLRARIKQLEAELELEKARHLPNDAILSSIPILEKEKLRLQSQVNEALQDLAKAKSQLRTASYTTNRLEAEKDVIETKYRKLEKDFEKLQNQNVELQFERDQLQREKKNRTNEKDMDMDANLVTIQSLSQRNEELTHSESELKERVCVLVKGLRDVKESVAKVKEENVLLHEEIVDNGVEMAESMKKCLLGLQQVVQQFNNESNKMADNDEIQRLTEELADSKSCCSALLQRVVELETNTGHGDISPKNYDGCPNCAKLEEEIKELHMDYDELKEKHEKLEEKMEEVSNDREDLFQETKYLKKVLSYRQDIMEVQVSEKTTRQLQRLETNLEEAEKKCKGLEDEVGVLYKQKQTLLENIMKLHDEEVAQQNADGDEDEDNDLSDEDDDDYSSDEQITSTPLPSRPKSGSMKKSLYANISNDAEFSSGASFYGSDTESESESDEWSELEGSSRRLQDLVSGLKSDRKRLRSNLKELMQDKRSLNKRIGKSTQDFKSLMKRMEKLDSENTSLREKVKTERRALKSKLKKEEKESERLRENLKDMESEKAALMKCIEMNSAAAHEVESNEPADDLEDDDISRLIAKAQAFAQEEKETKMQDAIVEESEEEAESVDEKDNEEGESGEKEEAESEEKSSSSSEEEEKEEEKREVEQEDKPFKNRGRAIPPPIRDIPTTLFQKDSNSEDEKDEKDKEEEERERYEMEDIMSPPPPPPHARLLQRRASTVGINMDRVNREKQHLEEEVASLKKYLNRSAYRRRYSTVETPKAPPLGAMKTLESLLQKSDMELKEANAKICHLQSINADLEERLKDAEMNQDDLRRAVVIANNYAAEEREKNTALEEEKDSLIQKLETLKRENSRLRKSRAINAVYRKGARGVKTLPSSDGDVVDSDGQESDLSSLSRRSSNASDL